MYVCNKLMNKVNLIRISIYMKNCGCVLGFVASWLHLLLVLTVFLFLVVLAKHVVIVDLKGINY